MSDRPENQGAETEKGFGTGLRAQLQRRREGDGAQVDAQSPTNVELRFELTARPAGDSLDGVVNPDVEALRVELQAAHAREASLRDQLQVRSEAYDQNVGSEKELAHRAATLDEREARLAEFEVELEERERRVRDQREAIEAEHARVANLQAELTAEQALAAEQREAAEARLRDLEGADRKREKASGELAKARAALDDRERKLAKKESELAPREQAGTARLDGRERGLANRENEWRTRDKELSERERKLSTRENDLKKEAARIAARDEAIGEREAEILLKQERLRDDAERFERELTDKGRAAREAVARAAELDHRELDLAAREAELNRLQASIAHAQRDANRGRDLEEWAARRSASASWPDVSPRSPTSRPSPSRRRSGPTGASSACPRWRRPSTLA